jgi:hypothetical protein
MDRPVGQACDQVVLRGWTGQSVRRAIKLRNRSHVSLVQPTSVDQPVDQARDSLTQPTESEDLQLCPDQARFSSFKARIKPQP